MSDLDRQASGTPYYEPDYHYCKKCGSDMEWADCWMIDCEEGYYDLHEEDCINYDPGTYAKCGEWPLVKRYIERLAKRRARR